MFETLSILPAGFWVVIVLLIVGGILALQRIPDATGLPTLTVLATVAFWYVGDAYYNDYANNHAKIFEPEILQIAWWEVAWFLVLFLVATQSMHRWVNASDLHRRSGVLQMFNYGVAQSDFQRQLMRLFRGCVWVWAILGVLAAFRLRGEVLHYFFPFIGYKAEPWGRGRMGGALDPFLTLAFYFQLLVAAEFGVSAALFTVRRTRVLALVFCALTWPYLLLDRTRNTMLAVMIPGMICWGLLRTRGSLLKKLTVLGFCFLLVNAWMAFVIANRSERTMMQALGEKGFKLNNLEKTHHEGLNMYEELCWVNTFIGNGKYNPNWGARYFAELVNPIPRFLWPGKPLIGIDYALARGQGGGAAEQAGVSATVSTGVIGQGVVNFGRILGPAAAALLMSLWVTILARQDLRINELGRLPLYTCGLILTFNLGRDISLLILYPFVFGSIVLWSWDHFHPRRSNASRRKKAQPNRSMIKRRPNLSNRRTFRGSSKSPHPI